MLNVIEKIGKFGAKCCCSRCSDTYTVANKYDAKKSPVGHLCAQCKNVIVDFDELNQDTLQALFNYNPDTGVVTHKLDTLRARAGDILGHKHNAGYLETTLGKHRLLMHRLIFMYMTGEMPEQVDHVNHIKTDNRWCNLRGVTNQVNQQNAGLSKNSTTSVNGVSLHKPTGRYRAYINVDYKQIHLGLFDTQEEAVSARKQANIKYQFHVNHGL